MIEEPCYHLFVYGSLRKGFDSPAYGYISQHFDYVAEGTVQGKLYDMGNYAAGVPAKDNGRIIGELYAIRHTDEFGWAIAQLDDYEGITASYDEIAQYCRALVPVLLENGQQVQAWVYWYACPTEGKVLIESGDMLQYLQQRQQS